MSATDFVAALASARRAVQLYPQAHPSFGEALDALVSTAAASTSDGPLLLNWFQGRLYHESTVIPEDVQGVRGIAEAFEARSIESVTIQPGFSAGDALGLTEMLSARVTPDFDAQGELDARGAQGVTVSALADEEDPEREERDKQRQEDRSLYQRMISALRRLQQQFANGGSGDLSEAGQLVGNIMERLLCDPSAVIGLATIRGTSDENLFHSLNVMIYTLALGHRLGLPEEGLSSLGMSALLHDVGKSAFVADDPDQAEPMRLMHPSVGAEILQRASLEDSAPMLVAYEHHLQMDGRGWPGQPADYVSHPFSRMVAITNRYDNLLAPGNGTEPLTPDKAVVRILQEAGTRHDPFFARLFANAVGVFPVGCLVRLSDHSVGVVSRVSEDPLSPTVRVAYDTHGAELDEPGEMDLATSDVTIVEVIQPEALNVAVADKL